MITFATLLDIGADALDALLLLGGVLAAAWMFIAAFAGGRKR